MAGRGMHFLPGASRSLLNAVLQRLPASHPALLWTCGSVRTTHTSQKHQQWSSSSNVAVFHHRSFHNVQHTLPSFRRPGGVSLYRYTALNKKPHAHTKGGIHEESGNKAPTAMDLVQSREIHSQKQKESRTPFVLSPQGLVSASPQAVQPYLRLIRLDRPIGTWLLFLPCAFSMSLSAPAGCLPDPSLVALFALGSVLMRGAGCTINDMWDKDYDAKVARTKDRPLACGQINYLQALTFLGLQLSGALAILLTFNWYTIGLGVSSIALCVTYPLMKRFTYWPQAFLGLTLNFGVLISWSALHGYLSTPGLLLYVACALHTMFYDTVYSHQDKEDDLLVGVKSTALRMGEDTKAWLSAFTAVIVSSLSVTGVMCDQTWPYYLGVAVFGGHLAKQVYTVDLNNPDDCGNKFRSNRNLGIMFWLMIMAGNLMRGETGTAEKKEGEENGTAE